MCSTASRIFRRWSTGWPLDEEAVDACVFVEPVSPQKRVDLGREDEVVEVQAMDGVGLQRDVAIAPAEANVGMVALRFREDRDAPHEFESLSIGLEREVTVETGPVGRDVPIRRLDPVAFGLLRREWRDTAPAGQAGLR